MPSNNTENIYSSEYGGSGQPIDADRIAYDNTTSGLSATDAQGAIDELAVSTAANAEDIEALEAEHAVAVTITADGVKTEADIMEAIVAAVDNTKITPRSILSITISGQTLLFNLTDKFSSTIIYQRTAVAADNLVTTAYEMHSSAANCKKYVSTTIATGTSFAEKHEDVVTNGVVFKLYY